MVDEKTKLLLVEDDKVDQLAFERFVRLKKLDYDYTIADSVTSAKKALESGSFETVIADYYLGDGDAFELLNMRIASPIIITTGAGSEEIAVKAIKAGAYDYLIKDADRNYLKVLPATVDNAIKNRQTRELLRLAEASYKDLYERVPVGLYRTDPTGRMLMANPRLIEMLGYGSFEEIAAVNAGDLFPGGREERGELLGLVEERGELHNHVFRLKKRGGGEITVRGSIKSMRGITGETQYYEGAIDDISEQIKADEILRMMHRAMESSLDGILITDPRMEDNPITYCNPAFLRITGYEMDEVMFRNCKFLQGSDREQDGVYKIREAMKTRSGCHVVLRNYTRDGIMFWNELSLAPVLNSDGELINYVGIVKDITDRMKMDEEIIKRQKLDSLSLFAGGIAHDLNNLLTTILLNVSLARSLVETQEKPQKLLSNTEAACERLGSLTRQLLTFSKGGRPELRDVPVHDIVYAAMQLGRSASGVDYDVDVPDGLWSVRADEGQIVQVMSNLMLNAIQAMPQGGVIRLSAENVEARSQGGDCVKITITDEGVGIPGHLLDKIFDPYFTTKKDGHGLGLAAAHAIMKNHGGDIAVESREGEGTTFTLHLPASSEHTHEKVERRGAPPEVKCGRVLVLEDEASSAIMLREMLERLGCTVETAGDGEEAIGLYKDAMDGGKPFDLVIADLNIEGGTGGAGALARLKEIDPGVTAVASVEQNEKPFGRDYGEHRFKALLDKPYTLEKLLKLLNRLL